MDIAKFLKYEAKAMALVNFLNRLEVCEETDDWVQESNVAKSILVRMMNNTNIYRKKIP